MIWRKTRTVLVATSILAAMIVLSCGSKNEPVSPNHFTDSDTLPDDGTVVQQNLPPKIDAVTVKFDSVVFSHSDYFSVPTSSTLCFTCVSSDSDGDAISTTWQVDCGTLDRTDSCSVLWTAPGEDATAEMVVTVSDGHQQTGDTLRIGIGKQRTWTMSYNLGGYEDGQEVLCTPDGGYLTLVSHGGCRLAKIADDGSLVWNRYYNAGGSFWGRSVVSLSDGGCAIVGGLRTLDGTLMLFDFDLLRLDAEGNLLWQKVFEGINAASAYDVVGLPDGGFLVVGSTDSYVDGNQGVCLIRTDSNGDLLWHKTYPGSRGTSIIASSDGVYAITGEMGAWCTGSADAFLLLIDADGNVIQQKTYGGSGGDLGMSICERAGGGYAIAGQSYVSTGGWEGFIVITDNVGNQIHWNTFGGNSDDLVRSVVLTPDGGFAIAGYTYSFGAGNADAYLVKTDETGTVLWQNTFGGTELEEGQDIVCTPDGGFVIVGRTMSFSEDLCDLYVIKTDSFGRVSP
ncbi:MAG: hypothetical protein AB1483_12245 [Candidatus Zixiibacteriota bacterium]